MGSIAAASSCVLPARASGVAGSRVTARAVCTKPQAKRKTVCASADPSTASVASVSVTESTMTIEKQRTIAKELVNYFNDRQYEQEYLASRVFGWTTNAEITNGRWVMFGLLVGMMTEYATGLNFVDQIKLTITNMGFADIYE